MNASNSPVERRNVRPAELSPQERRVAIRLIDADPEAIRRIRLDPRLDRTMTRLLEGYRAELIEGLERHLEGGLRRAKHGKLLPLPRRCEQCLLGRPIPA